MQHALQSCCTRREFESSSAGCVSSWGSASCVDAGTSKELASECCTARTVSVSTASGRGSGCCEMLARLWKPFRRWGGGSQRREGQWGCVAFVYLSEVSMGMLRERDFLISYCESKPNRNQFGYFDPIDKFLLTKFGLLVRTYICTQVYVKI